MDDLAYVVVTVELGVGPTHSLGGNLSYSVEISCGIVARVVTAEVRWGGMVSVGRSVGVTVPGGHALNPCYL